MIKNFRTYDLHKSVLHQLMINKKSAVLSDAENGRITYEKLEEEINFIEQHEEKQRRELWNKYMT